MFFLWKVKIIQQWLGEKAEVDTCPLQQLTGLNYYRKSQIKDEKEEYFMEDDTENNGDEKEETEDELKREPSLTYYDEVGLEWFIMVYFI